MIFQANRDEEPQAEQTAAAPKLHKGKVQHSIIGKDLKITGDLQSAGDITVHGTVEGNITCRSLTIGDAPTISSVTADAVRISGQFSGDIKAKQVFLASSAKVTGDILHESLEVQSGASIEGRLARMKGAKGKEEEKVTPLKSAQSGTG